MRITARKQPSVVIIQVIEAHTVLSLKYILRLCKKVESITMNICLQISEVIFLTPQFHKDYFLFFSLHGRFCLKNFTDKFTSVHAHGTSAYLNSHP